MQFAGNQTTQIRFHVQSQRRRQCRCAKHWTFLSFVKVYQGHCDTWKWFDDYGSDSHKPRRGEVRLRCRKTTRGTEHSLEVARVQRSKRINTRSTKCLVRCKGSAVVQRRKRTGTKQVKSKHIAATCGREPRKQTGAFCLKTLGRTNKT